MLSGLLPLNQATTDPACAHHVLGSAFRLGGILMVVRIHQRLLQLLEIAQEMP